MMDGIQAGRIAKAMGRYAGDWRGDEPLREWDLW
jgi:hypothetical protein